jgi:DNA repair protein RadD
MYVLRDYQEEATEACVQILESTKQCREIVVCATGDGKSLIQAEVAKRLNFPLIICAPSKELLEQNSKKLTEFGVEHTICSASLGKRDISKLTLATIGSIKNNWEEFKKMGVKGILLDEGHLGVKSGSTVRKFIKQAKIQNVCAITATPCVLESSMAGASIKMLNRTKWKLFTDIRYVHQISDSVKRGFWSPIVYRNIETDETMLQDNSTGSDYTVESQKRFYEANDINGKIVEELRIVQSEGKKSTIIFVPTISEAEELYSKIPNSAIVHSKMKKTERDFMVQAFKNLEIPVIINCGVLQIGFDHPLLDSMINGKPTKSVNLYYQIVGRIVRIHPKKKEGLVVDMVGNFKRFGKVEDFSFDNIEFYGWGMFGKDGVLLTDYPIASKHRPNKESLVKAGLKREAQEKEKEIDHENNRTNPVVGFGMWSGRKVWDIAKSPDAKRFFGWCGWFLEEQKKPSRYPKNHVLIAAINEYLQKEASEFGTPIKKNLDNRLVINIPNNLF